MTIVLTGVSGNYGGLVAEALLQRKEPSDLVAVARRSDAAAGLTERGVQVREADFDDVASCVRAFDGADVLLLVTTNGALRRPGAPAAQRPRRSGPGRSRPGRGHEPRRGRGR